MASALLASRNEPHWGEGTVYMRQNPNFTSFSSSSANPNKKQIYDDHHLSTPTAQKTHHGRYQHQQQQQNSNNFHSPDAPPPSISNDSSNRNPNFGKELNNRRGGGGGGFGESTKNGYVKFNISEYSKNELKDLKRRFVFELHQVRELSSQIESRQISRSYGGGGGFSSGGPGGSGSPPNYSLPPAKKGSGGGGLKRPYPFVEAKRGPGEARLIGTMKKKCTTILKKLLTDKYGMHVFNVPVDPIKLMLHDYETIIKNPMDLGTVKGKLEKGVYRTPLEFAADVRLTFQNALLYNPKGHEVNSLAERLLKTFNEIFDPAYQKFESDLKKVENENGCRSRSSSIVVPIGISDDEREQQRTGSGSIRRKDFASSTTPDRMRTVTPDRIMHKPPPFRGNSNQQSSKQLLLPPRSPLALPQPAQPVMPAALPVYQQQAVKQMIGGIGRPWSGKQPKPKAKDAYKRDMSTIEKEKLGDLLQNLPPDRMDQALQIIRKRNPDLPQDGDEIELDIEAFDVETLWELDRFMGNYKKMLSKIRKQSLPGGNQNYPAIEENKSPIAVEMPEAAAIKNNNRKAENTVMEEDVDIGEDIPTSSFPPVEIEKDAGYASDNKSGASTGSSSSDDSSSDSDSDSGSSSDSDSDGDEAQSPFVKQNDGFD
ncbi:transcription factor GTE2-like [Papaver somniferum]|uniref:transcription factor GTE2-like n=1 Tax=Papaver somniferum TaxID=3469 RepID=UPI000E6FAE09|nr:transcription factor GTE2-like [Papaver somniferum]